MLSEPFEVFFPLATLRREQTSMKIKNKLHLYLYSKKKVLASVNQVTYLSALSSRDTLTCPNIMLK